MVVDVADLLGKREIVVGVVARIGKRESRRIREEHNAAINDMSELLEALRETLEFAIEANNRLPSPESKEEMESGFGCNSWTVEVFKRARAAIAKATAE